MFDDFGYVKQDRDGMEVLFTLLAHGYGRDSLTPGAVIWASRPST